MTGDRLEQAPVVAPRAEEPARAAGHRKPRHPGHPGGDRKYVLEYSNVVFFFNPKGLLKVFF